MPSSSPLITVPTTFPRSRGAARFAAKATSICAVAAKTPTSALATKKTARGGGEPARREREGVRAAHRGHQAAALQQVAERHREQQADRVAELGDRDGQTGRRRSEPQVLADRAEQRLRVVQAGRARSDGDREQQDGRGGQRRSRQRPGRARFGIRRAQRGCGQIRPVGARLTHARSVARSARPAPAAYGRSRRREPVSVRLARIGELRAAPGCRDGRRADCRRLRQAADAGAAGWLPGAAEGRSARQDAQGPSDAERQRRPPGDDPGGLRRPRAPRLRPLRRTLSRPSPVARRPSRSASAAVGPRLRLGPPAHPQRTPHREQFRILGHRLLRADGAMQDPAPPAGVAPGPQPSAHQVARRVLGDSGARVLAGHDGVVGLLEREPEDLDRLPAARAPVQAAPVVTRRRAARLPGPPRGPLSPSPSPSPSPSSSIFHSASCTPVA